MRDAAFTNAFFLFVRLLLNMILLLLPAAATSLAAVRRRVHDTVQLGAIALAATALSGYLIFWSWFLSWRLVRPLGWILAAAALLYVIFALKKLNRESRLAFRPLLTPAGLVFTSSLLILALTYAYGGFNTPLVPPKSRFSHVLPADNELPFFLSDSMMIAHKIPKPLFIDWRASDRPPLETAITLSQSFARLGPSVIAYQLLAVLLQSLWIFALWLVMYARNINRSAIRLVLVGCLFSNFVFVNSTFVWPKLLAATYLLGYMALLLGGHLKKHSPFAVPMAITAGSLVAWSLLSHGGTAFAVVGLIPLALSPRFFSFKMGSITLLTALVLYMPWILFQKFCDPPGDRLIKINFAGVVPIDNRPPLQAILDSYHATPVHQLVENREQNLRMIFGTFQFWPTLQQFLFELPKQEPERSQARLTLAKSLNYTQFFFFPSTLGFFVLGIPLLLLGVSPRWRSAEWRLAILLLLFTVLTDIFWATIMFVPSSTIVHAGSYATILASFVSGILGFWIVARWLAVAITAAQLSLFAYIHFFLLVPSEGTIQYGMVALSVLALAGTLYLLLRLSGQNQAVLPNSIGSDIECKVSQ